MEHFPLLRLMPRTPPRADGDVFEVWNLVLHWSLVLGCWSLS